MVHIWLVTVMFHLFHRPSGPLPCKETSIMTAAAL